MDLTDFSLLYPDAETHKRHYTEKDSACISDEVAEGLGLSEDEKKKESLPKANNLP